MRTLKHSVCFSVPLSADLTTALPLAELKAAFTK